MSDASQERARAAQLPEGDVVGILLEQHARIRDMFADVRAAEGQEKKQAFDALRAQLAVHEAAEEMVLRPVARTTAGRAEAKARLREEAAAAKELRELELTDVAKPEFDARLTRLERSVIDHAEREEREEFPAVRAARSEKQLKRMGTMLRAVEKMAPTHPHPGVAGSAPAQWAVGPFAAIVDRTRDALKHHPT